MWSRRRAWSISPVTTDARGERAIEHVQHGGVLVAIEHIEDRRVAEAAKVVRLAARGGIEGRPVEHDERAPVGQSACLGNGRVEAAQRAVGVIKAGRHDRCGLERVGNAGLRKPLGAQDAAVAAAARTAVRAPDRSSCASAP